MMVGRRKSEEGMGCGWMIEAIRVLMIRGLEMAGDGKPMAKRSTATENRFQDTTCILYKGVFLESS